MEITWAKEAAGSYFATDKSGQVMATARKDGNLWAVEVAHDNRVRQVGTYRLAKDVAARVLAEQVKPEPVVRYIDEQSAQGLAEWEADQRAESRAVEVEALGMQTIDLHPFVAVVDVIAGTGVLISPPASEDVTLSEGGASLHDSLCADALRRLAPLGVEALEGEDGGLSLEGVTDDGRKVFSLYVSDCITTEPDFEEVAVSIEALREAAGL
ncbi:hypothetical protein ACFYWN_00325 [Streptomyces sp. NPDC002917]|uniref:hypothetical protein n=1 Tax=Streptomyces sp. NPDC002917 TaxID=3364671 RepID=UPI0036939E96